MVVNRARGEAEGEGAVEAQERRGRRAGGVRAGGPGSRGAVDCGPRCGERALWGEAEGEGAVAVGGKEGEAVEAGDWLGSG